MSDQVVGSIPNRPQILAFLQDCKQDPTIDPHRLILADWLDEQDDPRGDFIRIQCELAQLKDYDPACKVLVGQERKLLDQNRLEWFHPWIRNVATVRSSRGLLGIWGSVERLYQSNVPKLAGTEAWEWVEEFHSHSLRPGDLQRLLDASFLNSIGAFTLRNSHLHKEGASLLAAAEFLNNLSSLTLRFCLIGDHGLEAMAGENRFANLVRLDVSENKLRWPAIKVLGATPNRLEELDLSGNRFSTKGMKALRFATSLSSLKTLSLSAVSPERSGFKHLVRSEAFGNLVRLDLGNNPMKKQEVEVLAQENWITEQIEELRLAQCMNGSASVRLLVNAPWKRLRSLNVGANGIRGVCLEALLSNEEFLSGLTELNLERDLRTNADVRLLADCPGLRNLRSLNLAHSGLTNEGMEALVASPHLTELWNLSLHNNRFDNRGLEALSHSPMRNLTRLHLENTNVTEAGVIDFLNSDACSNLMYLGLGWTHCTSAIADALLHSPYVNQMQTLRVCSSWKNLEGDRERLKERFGPGIIQVGYSEHGEWQPT